MLSPQSDPARVRDAWAAVLESGVVQQGTGRLRMDRTSVERAQYCCLGVLCELALEAGVIGHYDGGDSFPSEIVTDWAGLADTEGGFLTPELVSDDLTTRNDRGSTFTEIANIIREEPEGLIGAPLAPESDDEYYNL